VEKVMKKLEENKIDIKQLVPWPADHCQQEESSTEAECSA
jgi:hypothetical protein